MLERLEDRLAPAVWTGLAGNGLWSSPGNWVNGAVPTSSDNYIIFETNLTTTSGGSTLNTSSTAYNTIDDIPNLAISGIIFDNGTVDTVHTAGSENPFALGGAAQAGTTGYTISGTNTISVALLGDNGSGIYVESGVSNGTPNSLQETFGPGITINQDTATSFSTQDTGTQLVFNGAVTLNGFALSVTGAGNGDLPGQGVVLSGAVSQAGGLNLNGRVTLAGTNTYTGGTALGSADEQTVVNVTNNAGLGSAANAVTIAADTNSYIILDGVSVTQSNLAINGSNALYGAGVNGAAGGTATWNGAITIDNGSDFIANHGTGSILKINGPISGGGGTLVVSSQLADTPGRVEFEQDNTYTGVTNLGAGNGFPTTLQIDSPGGLGAGGNGNGTTVNAGSSLVLNFVSGGALQDASGNAEQLNLGGAGVSNAGALQAAGNGTTTIPGAITLSAAATIAVNSGAVLDVNGPVALSSFALTVLDANAAGVDDAAIPGVNFGGVISGTGGLIIGDTGFVNTGTVVLGAVNTYTGGATVHSGVVIVIQSSITASGLGNSSVVGTPVVDVVDGQNATKAGQILLGNGVTVIQTLDLFSNANGGGLTTNGDTLWGASPAGQPGIVLGATAATAAPTIGATNGGQLHIGAVISGGGDTNNVATQTSLTVEGNGTVDFEANNTYFGQTIVGAAGQGSTTLDVDTGAGLGEGDTAALPTQDETIVANGSSLVLTGNFSLKDAASNPENLNLTGAGVSNLGALQVTGNGATVIPGGVTLNGVVNIEAASAGGTLVLSNVISGSGGLTVLSGAVTMTAAAETAAAPNTYTGATTVQTGATLELDKVFTLAGGATPLVAVPGALVVNGKVQEDLGVDSPAANAGYEIAVGGSVTINAGGTLAFQANVHQSLNQLTLNGGLVDLTQAGAQLTAGGALFVDAGAAVTTVNGAGPLTLGAGTTYSAQLDGTVAGSGYGQLDSAGTVNLGGATLNLTLGAVFPGNTSFTLLQAAQVVGTFGGVPNGAIITTAAGWQFTIVYTATSVTATTVLAAAQSTMVTVTSFDQPITLTAAFQFPPGTTNATGNIIFFDAQVILATVPFIFDATTEQGTATAVITTLSVGPHLIEAAAAPSSGPSPAPTPTPAPTPVPPTVTTVILGADGSLLLDEPSFTTPQVLSPAGTMKAVSTVLDSSNFAAIYTIVSDTDANGNLNTLWENYNGVWTERSSGSFLEISATKSHTGAAVLFGLLTDDSLWEETAASGLNVGWVLLSPAHTIQSISAVTDGSGNEWCYAIVPTSDNLWVYSAALPAGWQWLSTGSFQQVSAGLNAAGKAVAYSVVAGGQLWEQNPAFEAIGLNTGFMLLSGLNGLPATFQSVQAGSPDRAFAISSADETPWAISPGGGGQLSPIFTTTQVSATLTGAGTVEVFATLTDASLWEYMAEGISAFWDPILTGDAGSTSTP